VDMVDEDGGGVATIRLLFPIRPSFVLPLGSFTSRLGLRPPRFPSAMRLAVIGAAPTGLGAAFRLHELIQEGQVDASDLEVVVFEQVRVLSPSTSRRPLAPPAGSSSFSITFLARTRQPEVCRAR